MILRLLWSGSLGGEVDQGLMALRDNINLDLGHLKRLLHSSGLEINGYPILDLFFCIVHSWRNWDEAQSRFPGLWLLFRSPIGLEVVGTAALGSGSGALSPLEDMGSWLPL